MSLINDPTSYTSNDPRELYNNILVFIVKDDPKNKNHNPPEMHIFQCARVSVSTSLSLFSSLALILLISLTDLLNLCLILFLTLLGAACTNCDFVSIKSIQPTNQPTKLDH